MMNALRVVLLLVALECVFGWDYYAGRRWIRDGNWWTWRPGPRTRSFKGNMAYRSDDWCWGYNHKYRLEATGCGATRRITETQRDCRNCYYNFDINDCRWVPNNWGINYKNRNRWCDQRVQMWLNWGCTGYNYRSGNPTWWTTTEHNDGKWRQCKLRINVNVPPPRKAKINTNFVSRIDIPSGARPRSRWSPYTLRLRTVVTGPGWCGTPSASWRYYTGIKYLYFRCNRPGDYRICYQTHDSAAQHFNNDLPCHYVHIYDVTAVPTPAPHPCVSNTDSCDSTGRGGICVEKPGNAWECDCASGYMCTNGCSGAHTAHTCMAHCGAHTCMTGYLKGAATTTPCPSNNPSSCNDASCCSDPTLVPTPVPHPCASGLHSCDAVGNGGICVEKPSHEWECDCATGYVCTAGCSGMHTGHTCNSACSTYAGCTVGYLKGGADTIACTGNTAATCDDATCCSDPTLVPTPVPHPCASGLHSCDAVGNGGICVEKPSHEWECDCATGYVCTAGCSGMHTGHTCNSACSTYAGCTVGYLKGGADTIACTGNTAATCDDATCCSDPTLVPTPVPHPCASGLHSCDAVGNGGICVEKPSHEWECDCATGYVCTAGCSGMHTGHTCNSACSTYAGCTVGYLKGGADTIACTGNTAATCDDATCCSDPTLVPTPVPHPCASGLHSCDAVGNGGICVEKPSHEWECDCATGYVCTAGCSGMHTGHTCNSACSTYAGCTVGYLKGGADTIACTGNTAATCDDATCCSDPTLVPTPVPHPCASGLHSCDAVGNGGICVEKPSHEWECDCATGYVCTAGCSGMHTGHTCNSACSTYAGCTVGYLKGGADTIACTGNTAASCDDATCCSDPTLVPTPVPHPCASGLHSCDAVGNGGICVEKPSHEWECDCATGYVCTAGCSGMHTGHTCNSACSTYAGCTVGYLKGGADTIACTGNTAATCDDATCCSDPTLVPTPVPHPCASGLHSCDAVGNGGICVEKPSHEWECDCATGYVCTAGCSGMHTGHTCNSACSTYAGCTVGYLKGGADTIACTGNTAATCDDATCCSDPTLVPTPVPHPCASGLHSCDAVGNGGICVEKPSHEWECDCATGYVCTAGCSGMHTGHTCNSACSTYAGCTVGYLKGGADTIACTGNTAATCDDATCCSDPTLVPTPVPHPCASGLHSCDAVGNGGICVEKPSHEWECDCATGYVCTAGCSGMHTGHTCNSACSTYAGCTVGYLKGGADTIACTGNTAATCDDATCCSDPTLVPTPVPHPCASGLHSCDAVGNGGICVEKPSHEWECDCATGYVCTAGCSGMHTGHTCNSACSTYAGCTVGYLKGGADTIACTGNTAATCDDATCCSDPTLVPTPVPHPCASGLHSCDAVGNGGICVEKPSHEWECDCATGYVCTAGCSGMHTGHTCNSACSTYAGCTVGYLKGGADTIACTGNTAATCDDATCCSDPTLVPTPVPHPCASGLHSCDAVGNGGICVEKPSHEWECDCATGYVCTAGCSGMHTGHTCNSACSTYAGCTVGYLKGGADTIACTGNTAATCDDATCCSDPTLVPTPVPHPCASGLHSCDAVGNGGICVEKPSHEWECDCATGYVCTAGCSGMHTGHTCNSACSTYAGCTVGYLKGGADTIACTGNTAATCDDATCCSDPTLVPTPVPHPCASGLHSCDAVGNGGICVEKPSHEWECDCATGYVCTAGCSGMHTGHTCNSACSTYAGCTVGYLKGGADTIACTGNTAATCDDATCCSDPTLVPTPVPHPCASGLHSCDAVGNGGICVEKPSHEWECDCATGYVCTAGCSGMHTGHTCNSACSTYAGCTVGYLKGGADTIACTGNTAATCDDATCCSDPTLVPTPVPHPCASGLHSCDAVGNGGICVEKPSHEWECDCATGYVCTAGCSGMHTGHTCNSACSTYAGCTVGYLKGGADTIACTGNTAATCDDATCCSDPTLVPTPVPHPCASGLHSCDAVGNGGICVEKPSHEWECDCATGYVCTAGCSGMHTGHTCNSACSTYAGCTVGYLKGGADTIACTGNTAATCDDATCCSDPTLVPTPVPHPCASGLHSCDAVGNGGICVEKPSHEWECDCATGYVCTAGCSGMHTGHTCNSACSTYAGCTVGYLKGGADTIACTGNTAATCDDATCCSDPTLVPTPVPHPCASGLHSCDAVGNGGICVEKPSHEWECDCATGYVCTAGCSGMHTGHTCNSACSTYAGCTVGYLKGGADTIACTGNTAATCDDATCCSDPTLVPTPVPHPCASGLHSCDAVGNGGICVEKPSHEWECDCATGYVCTAGCSGMHTGHTCNSACSTYAGCTVGYLKGGADTIACTGNTAATCDDATCCSDPTLVPTPVPHPCASGLHSCDAVGNGGICVEKPSHEWECDCATGYVCTAGCSGMHTGHTCNSACSTYAGCTVGYLKGGADTIACTGNTAATCDDATCCSDPTLVPTPVPHPCASGLHSCDAVGNGGICVEKPSHEWECDCATGYVCTAGCSGMHTGHTCNSACSTYAGCTVGYLKGGADTIACTGNTAATCDDATCCSDPTLVPTPVPHPCASGLHSCDAVGNGGICVEKPSHEWECDCATGYVCTAGCSGMHTGHTCNSACSTYAGCTVGYLKGGADTIACTGNTAATCDDATCCSDPTLVPTPVPHPCASGLHSCDAVGNGGICVEKPSHEWECDCATGYVCTAGCSGMHTGHTCNSACSTYAGCTVGYLKGGADTIACTGNTAATCDDATCCSDPTLVPTPVPHPCASGLHSCDAVGNGGICVEKPSHEWECDCATGYVCTAGCSGMHTGHTCNSACSTYAGCTVGYLKGGADTIACTGNTAATCDDATCCSDPTLVPTPVPHPCASGLHSCDAVGNGGICVEKPSHEWECDCATGYVCTAGCSGMHTGHTCNSACSTYAGCTVGYLKGGADTIACTGNTAATCDDATCCSDPTLVPTPVPHPCASGLHSCDAVGNGGICVEKPSHEWECDCATGYVCTAGCSGMHTGHTCNSACSTYAGCTVGYLKGGADTIACTGNTAATCDDATCCSDPTLVPTPVPHPCASGLHSCDAVGNGGICVEKPSHEWECDCATGYVCTAGCSGMHTGHTCNSACSTYAGCTVGYLKGGADTIACTGNTAATCDDATCCSDPTLVPTPVPHPCASGLHSCDAVGNGGICVEKPSHEWECDCATGYVCTAGCSGMHTGHTCNSACSTYAGCTVGYLKGGADTIACTGNTAATCDDATCCSDPTLVPTPVPHPCASGLHSCDAVGNGGICVEKPSHEWECDCATGYVCTAGCSGMHTGHTCNSACSTYAGCTVGYLKGGADTIACTGNTAATCDDATCCSDPTLVPTPVPHPCASGLHSCDAVGNGGICVEKPSHEWECDCATGYVCTAGCSGMHTGHTCNSACSTYAGCTVGYLKGGADTIACTGNTAATCDDATCCSDPTLVPTPVPHPCASGLHSCDAVGNGGICVEKPSHEWECDCATGYVCTAGCSGMHTGHTCNSACSTYAGCTVGYLKGGADTIACTGNTAATCDDATCCSDPTLVPTPVPHPCASGLHSCDAVGNGGICVEKPSHEWECDCATGYVCTAGCSGMHTGHTCNSACSTYAGCTVGYLKGGADTIACTGNTAATCDDATCCSDPTLVPTPVPHPCASGLHSCDAVGNGGICVEKPSHEWECDCATGYVCTAGCSGMHTGHTCNSACSTYAGCTVGYLKGGADTIACTGNTAATCDDATCCSDPTLVPTPVPHPCASGLHSCDAVGNGGICVEKPSHEWECDCATGYVCTAGCSGMHTGHTCNSACSTYAGCTVGYLKGGADTIACTGNTAATCDDATCCSDPTLVPTPVPHPCASGLHSCDAVGNGGICVEKPSHEWECDCATGYVCTAGCSGMHTGHTCNSACSTYAGCTVGYLKGGADTIACTGNTAATCDDATCCSDPTLVPTPVPHPCASGLHSCDAVGNGGICVEKPSHEWECDCATGYVCTAGCSGMHTGHTCNSACSTYAGCTVGYLKGGADTIACTGNTAATCDDATCCSDPTLVPTPVPHPCASGLHSCDAVGNGGICVEKPSHEWECDCATGYVCTAGCSGMHTGHTCNSACSTYAGCTVGYLKGGADTIACTGNTAATCDDATCCSDPTLVPTPVPHPCASGLHSCDAVGNGGICVEKPSHEWECDCATGYVCTAGCSGMHTGHTCNSACSTYAGCTVGYLKGGADTIACTGNTAATCDDATCCSDPTLVPTPVPHPCASGLHSCDAVGNGGICVEKPSHEWECDCATGYVCTAGCSGMHTGHTCNSACSTYAGCTVGYLKGGADTIACTGNTAATCDDATCCSDPTLVPTPVPHPCASGLHSCDAVGNGGICVEKPSHEWECDCATGYVCTAGCSGMHTGHTCNSACSTYAGCTVGYLKGGADTIACTGNTAATCDDATCCSDPTLVPTPVPHPCASGLHSCDAVGNGGICVEKPSHEWECDCATGYVCTAGCSGMHTGHTCNSACSTYAGCTVGYLKGGADTIACTGNTAATCDDATCCSDPTLVPTPVPHPCASGLHSCDAVGNGGICVEKPSHEWECDCATGFVCTAGCSGMHTGHTCNSACSTYAGCTVGYLKGGADTIACTGNTAATCDDATCCSDPTLVPTPVPHPCASGLHSCDAVGNGGICVEKPSHEWECDCATGYVCTAGCSGMHTGHTCNSACSTYAGCTVGYLKGGADTIACTGNTAATCDDATCCSDPTLVPTPVPHPCASGLHSCDAVGNGGICVEKPSHEWECDCATGYVCTAGCSGMHTGHTCNSACSTYAGCTVGYLKGGADTIACTGNTAATCDDATCCSDPTLVPTPVPHPCVGGTHSCDAVGNGGICVEKPNQEWECRCATGYVCTAGCSGMHTAHTCNVACSMYAGCSVGYLVASAETIACTGNVAASCDDATCCSDPTDIPTAIPTNVPTNIPTNIPTTVPTNVPTDVPTTVPTDMPTAEPTSIPTDMPTGVPSDVPTDVPSAVPTDMPTAVSTNIPTDMPTTVPTDIPTDMPTAVPTDMPTAVPTNIPTDMPTTVPTDIPTDVPSAVPTDMPTDVPTNIPTDMPTAVPTDIPTDMPTAVPTDMPTDVPTNIPTDMPTAVPTNIPTDMPTAVPTDMPTAVPTNIPTDMPTAVPTDMPTAVPTNIPTDAPTAVPTDVPTTAPTGVPTLVPTDVPTARPTFIPTQVPTNIPTSVPTAAPHPCAAGTHSCDAAGSGGICIEKANGLWSCECASGFACTAGCNGAHVSHKCEVACDSHTCSVGYLKGGADQIVCAAGSCDDATCCSDETTAPTPVPHPCAGGSHSCDAIGNGGICVEKPNNEWACQCASGFACTAGCSGTHVAHTCTISCSGHVCSVGYLRGTAATITCGSSGCDDTTCCSDETQVPTAVPTNVPTAVPTMIPRMIIPTSSPKVIPLPPSPPATVTPSTDSPTESPTESPNGTLSPSVSGSLSPDTSMPTTSPTDSPTESPTQSPGATLIPAGSGTVSPGSSQTTQPAVGTLQPASSGTLSPSQDTLAPSGMGTLSPDTSGSGSGLLSAADLEKDDDDFEWWWLLIAAVLLLCLLLLLFFLCRKKRSNFHSGEIEKCETLLLGEDEKALLGQNLKSSEPSGYSDLLESSSASMIDNNIKSDAGLADLYEASSPMLSDTPVPAGNSLFDASTMGSPAGASSGNRSSIGNKSNVSFNDEPLSIASPMRRAPRTPFSPGKSKSWVPDADEPNQSIDFRSEPSTGSSWIPDADQPNPGIDSSNVSTSWMPDADEPTQGNDQPVDLDKSTKSLASINSKLGSLLGNDNVSGVPKAPDSGSIAKLTTPGSSATLTRLRTMRNGGGDARRNFRDLTLSHMMPTNEDSSSKGASSKGASSPLVLSSPITPFTGGTPKITTPSVKLSSFVTPGSKATISTRRAEARKSLLESTKSPM